MSCDVAAPSADGDAGGLLAAVLEGVEAPVGEAGGVGVVVDGHDAAVFAELVEGGVVVFGVVDVGGCGAGWCIG